MPNKKIFVLDTSVLLYDSNSIRSFGSKEIVIPYAVLEELDRFKTREDLVGKNARQVARDLNRLRQQGALSGGVEVNAKGGILRVKTLNSKGPSADDDILATCAILSQEEEGSRVVLVTKDINLAVRADSLCIVAQDFDSDKTLESVSDSYSGCAEVVVADDLIDRFYSSDPVLAAELEIDLYPNQYVTLVGQADSSKTALARAESLNKPLVKIRKKGVWGIKPRNREQQYAIDSLLNPDISLVTLTGKAGTGKTLIALACALHLVQDMGQYDRLVVSRPVQPLGKDIGFLPGDIHEKMSPWMGPIKDSLEFLTRGKDKSRDMYSEMIAMKMLEVEPLTYIRGRSLPNTIFLIDECQDVSRPEIKTIVSRMGENSKLVLIGDTLQISNPYLDATNSGLSNVVERFKPYGFSSHVSLVKGERSELATVAAEIL